MRCPVMCVNREIRVRRRTSGEPTGSRVDSTPVLKLTGAALRAGEQALPNPAGAHLFWLIRGSENGAAPQEIGQRLTSQH